jgi:hypothetical protein
MPFPTATITQGSGLTINTLPNAGQATMANSLGVAIASDQSPISTNADVRATSQTINSATLNASVVVALNNGEASVGFNVSGLTASGATLVSEASSDGGVTYGAINAVFAVSGTLATSQTTDGIFTCSTPGKTHARLRVSVVGSGTITVAYSASSVSSQVSVASPLPPGSNLLGSITPLNTGALANPTSTLTRAASAVSSASVTFTVAAPCVFTWTSNSLVNGQTVVPSGSVPTGFTAGLVYYVVGVSGNNFSLATTFGGTGVTSTGSAGTCTITVTYVSGGFIGSAAAAGSVVVPSFAMPAAGLLISRVRINTNVTGTLNAGSYNNAAGTNPWNNANLSVSLWTAAPTYANGDGGPYAPATGGANLLANFLVGLTQFGDQASGSGPLTSAGQMALKLGAAQNIFWDIQILSQVAPIASQTFTLTAELMN